MAVQAQYPANLLLLDRQETERSNKDMDLDFPPPPLLDQSAVFFSSNGGNVNLRKRGREVVPPAFGVPMVFVPPPLLPMQQTVFSLQPAQTPTPAMIGFAQLRSPAPPPQVSTGLRLALDQQNPIHPPDFDLSSFISDELAAQINQQKDEIDQFLLSQREQLRRAFAEHRHRHYRALLKAVDQSIGRRFQEKEAEIERATRLSSELEERLSRLQTESMAWQSKAMAEQATAASLHAQLQRAAAEPAAGKECSGESPADDAESAYIDPERPEIAKRACHACLRRPASVVLIPCRHLCLCPACDSAGGVAGGGCPVCGCPRTGSVQVFLS